MDVQNYRADSIQEYKITEKILRENFQIEISQDVKEELKKMGGLMEPLLNIAKKQAAKQAEAETEKTTLIKNIRSLMKTLNLTAQQAMDALQISADKQKEYISLI